jgi:hypothetical protein
MQIEKNLLYQRILFVAFWIRATFSFFAEEIVPPLIPGEQYAALLFDATLVAIGLLTLHKKGDIIMLVAFVAVEGVITCFYNKLSIVFYVNGLRDFISFLFIVPIMHYFFENPDRKERFVAAFDKQLYIFLLLQMFCVTWQISNVRCRRPWRRFIRQLQFRHYFYSHLFNFLLPAEQED